MTRRDVKKKDKEKKRRNVAVMWKAGRIDRSRKWNVASAHLEGEYDGR